MFFVFRRMWQPSVPICDQGSNLFCLSLLQSYGPSLKEYQYGIIWCMWSNHNGHVKNSKESVWVHQYSGHSLFQALTSPQQKTHGASCRVSRLRSDCPPAHVSSCHIMLLLRSDSLETFFHPEGIVVGIDGPALFIDQDMLGWYWVEVEGINQEDTGKEGINFEFIYQPWVFFLFATFQRLEESKALKYRHRYLRCFCLFESFGTFGSVLGNMAQVFLLLSLAIGDIAKKDLLRGASWPSVGFGSPSLCTAGASKVSHDSAKRRWKVLPLGRPWVMIKSPKYSASPYRLHILHHAQVPPEQFASRQW